MLLPYVVNRICPKIMGGKEKPDQRQDNNRMNLRSDRLKIKDFFFSFLIHRENRVTEYSVITECPRINKNNNSYNI